MNKTIKCAVRMNSGSTVYMVVEVECDNDYISDFSLILDILNNSHYVCYFDKACKEEDKAILFTHNISTIKIIK